MPWVDWGGACLMAGIFPNGEVPPKERLLFFRYPSVPDRPHPGRQVQAEALLPVWGYNTQSLHP